VNPKQVVLITGASSGFGRLIAETLARKNYQVLATMRNVKGRSAEAVCENRESRTWRIPLFANAGARRHRRHLCRTRGEQFAITALARFKTRTIGAG
jgi:NAD(P)-dependent dehydrogenase (short-subunit alcohol dehydrogenase family)